jgi:osmotically-inducible protein OsmY
MRQRLSTILAVLAFAVLSMACTQQADIGITTKVKSLLDSDRAISNSAQIQVTTEKMVVTLAGPVDSPATKVHAVTLAKGVEGVKKVVDNLTVAPSSVAVAQPAAIETLPGTATAPTDTASSQAVNPTDATTKQAAKPMTDTATPQAAKPTTDKATKQAAKPTTDTATKQAVKPTTDTATTQAAIPTTDMATTQAAKPMTDTATPETAKPMTDTATPQAVKPTDTAATTQAVKPTDTAATTQAVKPTDTAITQAVKDKLLLRPDASTESIGVDTHEGVVTLSGTVKSTEVKAQVIRTARGIEGVQRVEDKLSVSTS